MRLLQSSGKKQTDSSGTTINYTFPAELIPGSTVIGSLVHYGVSGGSRISSITFSGYSGTRDVEKGDSGNINWAEIWRANNVTGNSNTISLTVPSGSYVTGSFEEWRGILVNSQLDANGNTSQTTSSNTPSVSSSSNTTQEDELCYAVFCDYTGTNWGGSTPPTGATEAWEEFRGDLHQAGSGAYKVFSTIQTPAAMAFLTSSNMNYIAALATYKIYGPTHQNAVVRFGVGGTTPLTSDPVTTSNTPGMLLVGVGRGAISDHTANNLTDNKSNEYNWLTIGGNTVHNYGSDWPTSGPAIYSCANPNGGSSHTFTSTRTTSGDEITILAVETPNGFNSIVDSSWVYASSGNNISNSVTTTAEAWLYCFWWGADVNGEANPIPENGWYKLEWTSNLASNHVQGAVFAKKVTTPGTYTCTVTPGTTQKAQMHLIAIQAAGSSQPSPSKKMLLLGFG